jgi:hypothetical protein
MNSMFNDLPPCPPALVRTLSHGHAAKQEAEPYFDQCKEGETIFSNYFMSYHSMMVDVEYYTRMNGVMKLCQIREHYNRIISYPWTYYGTPLPSLQFINFPGMEPLKNPSEPFEPLVLTPLLINDA